jgi:predicted metallopeptidase
LLDRPANAAPSPAAGGLPGPHFAPRAKRVVFCFMDGGVSHVDSFDPKPQLDALDGKPFTESKNPTANGNRQWLKSPWAFSRHGESGLPVSDLFPHIAQCADELAVIRSMKADLPIHSTGVLRLHTGANNAGRPSLGSWCNYGLGSENENLPGFVVLSFGVVPCGGLENFSSGFLPASHQASLLRADGTPIENIQPADKDPRIQQAKLALLTEADKSFSRSLSGNQAVEAVIKNYELAYRMQSLVPDVLDLGRETQATHRLYGIDSAVPSKRLYGIQCLRARRLIESGVRFVEITCPPGASNGTWDQHGNLKAGHEKNALDTDQAVAGLICDLKARGLFEDTLVVWAGEFGRTPHSAGRDGRDHHPEGFTVWLAGGGVKGGTVYGATDELGMYAVDNICTIHDLHATILHLLGLDHERLTFRSSGRDFRLTDVHGRVIDAVIG